MQCPQCRARNRSDRHFGGQCGAALELACAVGGFANEPVERFRGGRGPPLALAIFRSLDETAREQVTRRSGGSGGG
jgi:hypothetical protein